MDIALRVVVVVVGAGLFFATVHAILSSMLIPRPRSPFIARVAQAPSRAIFRTMAFRRKGYLRRDAVLAAAGPVTVLSQLVVFVILFVVASALMIYGFDGQDISKSAYEAGSSLLTLGIVGPVSTGAIVVGLVAAFVGLVVVAILVGYLLTLYSAFSDRESAVARLGLLTGEPAWGPELICRTTLLGDSDRTDLYHGWIEWTSNVRLNHAVYPILNQFRSSQPCRHWLVSLIAVLDAAAIEISVLANPSHRPTLLRLLSEGTETLSSLRAASAVVAMPARPMSDAPTRRSAAFPGATASEEAVLKAIRADAHSSLVGPSAQQAARDSDDPGITRAEWDRAREVLIAAGAELRGDEQSQWETFASIRRSYAHNAYALAEFTYAPPAPWTGPRRPAAEAIWPALAVEVSADRS